MSRAGIFVVAELLPPLVEPIVETTEIVYVQVTLGSIPYSIFQVILIEYLTVPEIFACSRVSEQNVFASAASAKFLLILVKMSKNFTIPTSRVFDKNSFRHLGF